jgi:type VII secretion integral membrane protein EccD
MSAPATGHLSRVTLAGPRRRIDLVLPADEPVGLLLPEVVGMVGHPPMNDSRGYQISTLDGTVLDPAVSLRASDIPDGALLRVDPIAEAPPAAIVHDVSDEVADDLSRRRGRWNDRTRVHAATAVSVIAATFAAVLAEPHLGEISVTLVGAAVAFAGLGVGSFGRRALGVAVLVSGAAMVMSTVPSYTDDLPLRCGLWAAGVGVTVLVLGSVTGNRRAGILGGGTLLFLLAGWALMLGLGMPAGRVASIMTIVSIGVLGLLPRFAMMTSGLTRLDDLRSNDEPVNRVAVAAAVDAAHRGLAVASIAAAASATSGGLVLAWGTGPWTLALAALVSVALLLRMRAFPLAVEVATLVTGSLAVMAGLLARWVRDAPGTWWGPPAAALGVCAVALVVLAYRPPPHVRARARQNADRFEAAAVIALVPVTVGVFGLYSRLLDTF